MASTGPSRSAILVALTRAHLTRKGILDDQYARQMLPRGWAMAESLMGLAPLDRLGRSRSFAYLAARTCFYDELATTALDAGVRQVVIVGAGYDSRAWRFRRPGVAFFEVDLPATQADKRSRAPVGGPVYVLSDITDSALAYKLEAAGFRLGEATAFTVEGVTMYLKEHQVDTLLVTLAGMAGPDSRLGVNFGVGFERQGSRRGRAGRQVMALAGEAFCLRLDPREARERLARSGWSLERL